MFKILKEQIIRLSFFLFITTRKRSLGQGNIFSSVCQEFCSQGGIPACIAGGIPACLAGLQGVVSQHALQVSRPTPKGEVEGLAREVCRGVFPGPHLGGFAGQHLGRVSRSTPRGSAGPHLGGSPGTHRGGSPGPHLGGIPARTEADTPPPPSRRAECILLECIVVKVILGGLQESN